MRDSMPRLIPVPDRPPIPAPTLYGPGTAGVPRTRPSDRSVSLMWPVVRVLIRMCSSKSSGTSGCRNLSPGHSQNLVHQIRHSREQSGCKCCQRHLRGQAARPRNAIRVAMDGDERRARNLQEQRRNREKAAADKAQKQAADRERHASSVLEPPIAALQTRLRPTVLEAPVSALLPLLLPSPLRRGLPPRCRPATCTPQMTARGSSAKR